MEDKFKKELMKKAVGKMKGKGGSFKKKEDWKDEDGKGGPKHKEGSAWEEKHESKDEAKKEGDEPMSKKYKNLSK